MKILVITDKRDTAIDRLAMGLQPYMHGYDRYVLPIHPKRPAQQELEMFEQALTIVDVIDFQYFKTALMLLGKYPAIKSKFTVLQHHNPYSIYDNKWDQFSVLVTNNKTIQSNLIEHTQRQIELVYGTVEPLTFPFNRDYAPSNKVLMVANRIEAKKGILEVAEACKIANCRLLLVGNISDHRYFEQVIATGVVEFSQNISDQELSEKYHEATVHICNSQDNFESGTLPIVESMLSGLPVITRNIGIVPDIYSGENLVLNPYAKENIEKLSDLIIETIADHKKLNLLREKGWLTAKQFTNQRRAYQYKKIYRKAQGSEQTVSVIVPIYSPDSINECLSAIDFQTYNNIEIIAVDDNNQSNEKIVKDFSFTCSKPVQYFNTAQNDYGLARARNKGIIEATGDILVFCDQRQIMDKYAIENFVKNLTPKVWLFGNKGANKKDFVENFSCIYRNDIVQAGMFNERCNLYGSLTQEIRNRTRAQGIEHRFLPESKAHIHHKSKNKYSKKLDIIKSKDMLWQIGL